MDEWIAEVRRDQATVGELAIKEAAKKFTAPPIAEYKKADIWGNIEKQQVKSGQLVNRITSTWYLDEIEQQCAMFIGFLAFARSDFKVALKNYARIPKLDTQISDSGDLISNPNDYQRLKFGAQNGYLFAYPQELKLYIGRNRLVVLLADFYFVTQQYSRVIDMSERMLDGEFGRLNKKQQDYPRYIMGHALYRNHRTGANNSIEPALKAFGDVYRERDGTFTELRAMHAYAMLADSSKNEILRVRGEEIWRELIESKRDHPYVHRARISLAVTLRERGRLDEAISLLSDMNSSDPTWEAAALYYIKKFERLGRDQ